MATHVGFLKDGQARPRRGARDAQGAFPAAEVRERGDGGAHGVRPGARGVRRRAREGARLGRGGDRLELRRRVLRALLRRSRASWTRSPRPSPSRRSSSRSRARPRPGGTHESLRRRLRAGGRRAPARLPRRARGGLHAARSAPSRTGGRSRTRARAGSSWRSSRPRRLASRSRSSSGAPSSPARRRRSGSRSSSPARSLPPRSGAASSSPSSSSCSLRGLILAPALLTGSVRTLAEHAGRQRASRSAPGLALPGRASVVLILGAHAAVTVARLRSPWVALDLLLAPALVLLAVAPPAFPGPQLRRLRIRRGPAAAGSSRSPRHPVLGLLVATFVQVAEGRTGRPPRARRLLGRVLRHRRRGRRPRSADTPGGARRRRPRISCRSSGASRRRRGGPGSSPAGGSTSGAGAGSFLFDTAGGRSLRLHGLRHGLLAGRHARRVGRAAFRILRKERQRDRTSSSPTSRRAAPSRTGLEAAGWVPMALSPSGRRLAIRDGRTLSRLRRLRPGEPEAARRLSPRGGQPRLRVRRRGDDPALPAVLQPREPQATSPRRASKSPSSPCLRRNPSSPAASTA